MKLRIQRHERATNVWYTVEKQGWFNRWSSVYTDVHSGCSGVTFTSDVRYDSIEAAQFDLNRYLRGLEPTVSTTVREVNT